MQNHRAYCFCQMLLKSTFILCFFGLITGCQMLTQSSSSQPKTVKIISPKPLDRELVVDISTLSPQVFSQSAKLQVLLIESTEIGLIGSIVAEQVTLLNESGQYALSLSYLISDVDVTRPHHLQMQVIDGGAVIYQQTHHIKQPLVADKTVVVVLDLSELVVEAVAAAPSLGNSVWHLVKIGNISVKNHSEQEVLHMHFVAEDNSIFGFSGCNRFSGFYQLEGNKINFRQLRSTRKMCLENMMLERTYLGMLSEVKGFSLNDNQLVLLDSKNNQLAEFYLEDSLSDIK